MFLRIPLLFVLLLSSTHSTPEQAIGPAMVLAHLEQLPLELDYPGLVATMHVETGGTLRSDLVSRANACGVMQVLPKWSKFSCKEMKHPMSGILAGLYAWEYWRNQSKRSIYSTAAHYNGGNRPGLRATRQYAPNWAFHHRRITNIFESATARPLTTPDRDYHQKLVEQETTESSLYPLHREIEAAHKTKRLGPYR